MQLFFADWSAATLAYPDHSMTTAGSVIADGTPILVDESMRPVEPWCSFLRLYSTSISKNSTHAYSRDTARFAAFLSARSIDVQEVRHRDLTAYRDHRLKEGLSLRSWSRELVPIRALFRYLYETGQRDSLPWVRVGRGSVVTPRPPTTDMDVRALSRAQWLALRNIGFGGDLPSGELDPSYRGQSTVRNVCAAEVALTTGMRISEWRTLLAPEVASTGAGTSLLVEACAKNGRRRRVYIPASSVQAIELYRSTERRSLVGKAQKNLRRKLPGLAVVSGIDVAAGKLTYRLNGSVERRPYQRIPPETRRILVRKQDDGWIEPLSLFVGRGGFPPSQRRWHQYFADANSRVASFRDVTPAMPPAVTPHDLRHIVPA